MDILSEHMARPRHSGKLVGATGRSIHVSPLTGDAIRIAVRIDGDQVSPKFSSFGDPTIGAVASFVCEKVHEHGLAVIPELTVERLTNFLRLPADKIRCAQLVVLTLLEAVQDHQNRQRLGREVEQ